MKTRKLYPPTLWVKCLIASLAIHSAALYVWIKHPLFFTQPLRCFFVQSKPIPELLKQQKDEPTLEETLAPFLEEFFVCSDQASDSLDCSKLYTTNQTPLIEQSKLLTNLSSLLKTPLLETATFASFQSPSFPSSPSFHHTLISGDLKTPTFQKFFLFQNNPHSFPSLPSLQESIEEDQTTLFSNDEFASLSQEKINKKQTFLFVFTQPPLTLQEGKKTALSEPLTPFASPLQKQKQPLSEPSFPFAFPSDAALDLSMATLANAQDLIPSQALYSLQWQDSFHITPSFFPDEDGYVFFISITPKQNLEFQKIKQNIYFLIDCSSAIEKHKLSVFKKSTIKALSSLQSGDSFNIFLLDKTITAFSPYSCPFSLQNLKKAEHFLEKEPEKNIFSSFNLLKGLKEAFHKIETDDEVHTAILLTNGNFSNSFSSQQKALNEFLEKNNGKIHLFTAAVGKNNNIVNLDLLSSLCGGKLLYSDTNASFPRKLAAFLKTMQAPLAKDITLSISPKDPKAELSHIPTKIQLPNLYNKEPFIICGKINRLCDLTLTLEGKNEDGWILIHKDVSFLTAQEAPSSLKKEWELRQAIFSYEKFLEDSKSMHLKEAKKIIDSAHGRVLGE